MAWLSWIEPARKGPHGANVVVHPWESGMDNSPSWDQPLSVVPEVSPATLDEHQADTFGEHVFVNVLSPWSSSVAP
jgi:hypothetical protein